MKNREIQYLEFDKLETIPRVAGLLPCELASRYHALPVAGDGERITVAMANPDDKEGREAIFAVLGPSVCFVRADDKVIDRLLVKFWDMENERSLELLLWIPTNSSLNEVKTYSNDLAALLGAHISQFETPDKGTDSFIALSSEIEQINADIVITGELDQSLLEKLIEKPVKNKSAKRLPTSLLVVRQPSWPIKNILLVLRTDAQDEIAVDWTVCLARPTRAEVTILPLTLPLRDIDDQDLHMHCSIDTVLISDTEFGKKLRLAAQRLVSSEISGTLRLRQEPPTWQIRFELLENEYDLVIIDCGPPDMLWHSILCEVADPLLSWTDKPMLITKSATV
jgi:hypothetical protein